MEEGADLLVEGWKRRGGGEESKGNKGRTKHPEGGDMPHGGQQQCDEVFEEMQTCRLHEEWSLGLDMQEEMPCLASQVMRRENTALCVALSLWWLLFMKTH